DRDGFFKLLVAKQIENGCKGLLLNDLEMRLHFRNDRSDVTSRLIPFSFEHTAFYHDVTAFCFNLPQGIALHFHSLLIDQRSDMISRIQWIADTQLLISRYEAGLHFLVHIFVNNESTGGRTTLPRSTYRSEEGTASSDIEIGIRCNDDGIVSAELK